VLDRLQLRGDERVLDAGCGTGRISQQLLERLPRGQLVALDGDPAMIAQARRRLSPAGERVEFVLANLDDPLPITPVDAIFSTATFHWVKDHDRLFGNLAAALKPGGQLVAQFGGAGNVSSFLAVMNELGQNGQETWNFPTAEDTAARLKRLGFTDVRVWLNAEPTPFASRQEMAEFTRVSCLGPWLARLPVGRHDELVQAVAERLHNLELDYVRLNVIARQAA